MLKTLLIPLDAGGEPEEGKLLPFILISRIDCDCTGTAGKLKGI
jgi:hypothetical protein